MPITTPRVKEHQTRWNEIVRDPSLRDLPYKVETNSRGKIVLSPHRNRHSFLQETIQDLLDEHAPEGSVPPEFAIVTSEGVKVPDVVWMSPGRRREMAETGDPTTLAPEVCVEITSSSNTAEEIQEKRALYLNVGAEEVWVVDEEEHIRIYDHEGEREGSAIASTVPSPL
jgi:Uma2 family endonuclease